MSFVDSGQDSFDMGFRLKGRVEGSVIDGRGQLAVRKDVGISTNRGLPKCLVSVNVGKFME